jgi:transcription initiation factor TFIIB
MGCKIYFFLTHIYRGNRLMGVKGSNLDYIEKRALNNMYTIIDQLSETLGASGDVVEKAKEIAFKCIEKRLQRGRSYKCIALAAIYTASRIAGKPIPIKQISLVTETPLEELRSCYNSLLKALWGELRYRKPPDPSDYIESIASRIEIDSDVIAEARRILDTIKREIPFMGKDPTSYAAAAIYIAARKLGKPISKTRVSLAAGITEVTVRARLREMAEKLGVDVEEEVLGSKARGGGSKRVKAKAHK